MSLSQLGEIDELKASLERKNYTKQEQENYLHDLLLKFQEQTFNGKPDHDFLIDIHRYISEIQRLCPLCKKKIERMEYKNIKDCSCIEIILERFKKDSDVKTIIDTLRRRLFNSRHPTTTFYLPDVSAVMACIVYTQETETFYIDINPDLSLRDQKIVPASKLVKFQKLQNKLNFSIKKYGEITSENLFDFFCDFIEAILCVTR